MPKSLQFLYRVPRLLGLFNIPWKVLKRSGSLEMRLQWGYTFSTWSEIKQGDIKHCWCGGGGEGASCQGQLVWQISLSLSLFFLLDLYFLCPPPRSWSDPRDSDSWADSWEHEGHRDRAGQRWHDQAEQHWQKPQIYRCMYWHMNTMYTLLKCTKRVLTS